MTVLKREETVADYPAVHKLIVDAFGQEDEASLVEYAEAFSAL